MKRILIALFLISIASCSKKEKLLGATPWQRTMNANFKDASKSPLKAKDRKSFKTLDFFVFDSSYVVNAYLRRTPYSQWFKMNTTTNEVTLERVFGVLSFTLKGQHYELEVYQGQELLNTEGYKDYLFLPFLDNTNGIETYGGGRYLDLRIPEGDSIVIDFNKSYNPYCVYNEKYSCPIVPRRNYLKTKIEGGVKVFYKG